jgi:hypothetical protein
MKSKWFSSILIPLLGLVVLLAIGLGCTELNHALLVRKNMFFDVSFILLLVYALTNLICIGATLLLFWAVMVQTSRSKVVGWGFTCVGIGIVA